MRILHAVLIPVALSMVAGPLCAADQPQVRYQQAAAVLKKYCAGCHNDDEPEGKFSLESFASLSRGTPKGPALLAGDADGSRLIRVMVGKAKPQMPPRRKPQPKPQEIELLKAWIAAGAKGPDGKAAENLTIVAPKIKPRTDQRPVTALDLSADGKLLAVAAFSKVSLYEVSPAGPLRLDKPVRVFEGFPGKVTSVHLAPDSRRLITASGLAGVGGEAAIWNIADGKQIKRFKGHTDLLYDAELSPTGKLLATCSYDRTIKIWDADSGKLLRTLEGHNGAVYDIAFSPDGQFLVSASADDTCKVWRVRDGLRLDTLGQPLREVYACTFSPDGRHIVAGGADNNIRVWKFTSRDKARINPMVAARFAHQGAIVRLAFSADGKRLVSSAEDRTVKVWDTADYREVQSRKGEPEVSAALAVAADGFSYIVGRLDGSLARHEIDPVAKGPDAAPVKPNATPIPARAPAKVAEVEPNDLPDQAQEVKAPVQLTGAISGRKEGRPDTDLFRFTARAGQQWVLEVNAARSKSKLDSFIEILDARGKRVPRVVLQAVRDSYFTFRGKDGYTSDDFRLFNWKEMHLNDYLYANGEVVKLWRYPRGPDSGFKVYPGQGKRWGSFDTTPLTHALGETCYIVKPFAPGVRLTPNGLPTFTVHYQNDDDARRELGSDSRLFFEAPADGTYLVRIKDVRGFEGADFKYTLTIRPRQPDFRIQVVGGNPVVGAGSATEFTVKAERIDGFEGPIRVDVTGLPPGFSATSPLIIEAGQIEARGLILAAADAPPPSQENAKTSKVSATALIDGRKVTHPVNNLGLIKLERAPKYLARIVAANKGVQPTTSASGMLEFVIEPGESIMLKVKIDRKGYKGPVSFGGDDSGRNLPFGAYVDNIGLNGLLILGGATEREFFISADPLVTEQTRLFHLTSKSGDGQSTLPVLLRVRRNAEPASD